MTTADWEALAGGALGILLGVLLVVAIHWLAERQ